MIESFYIRSSTKFNNADDSNMFLLALFGLINASSNAVQNDTNDKGEFVGKLLDQRKWLEVLVDFLLNINENKNYSESDYINSSNYSQQCSDDMLRFLFKIYTNQNIMNYYLVLLIPIAKSIRISEYLQSYMDNKITEMLNNLNNSLLNIFDFLSIGVHIQNVIKYSKNERSDITIKKKIITLIQNLYKFYQFNHNVYVMKTLTECLCVLYETESIYYDDQNLLELCLNNLSLKLSDKVFPFDDMSKESDEHNIAIQCIINLTCLSYKANLVGKEFIVRIYQYLISVRK